MTEHEAFLQAILEAPEDDAPRLIYADWLDDHGDAERADFIRTQVFRARLPADDPRQRELGEREQALLAAHAEAWQAHLPVWARIQPPHFRAAGPARGFRRGFLAQVHTRAELFAREW